MRTASSEHQHPVIRHSAGRHAGAVAAPHTPGGGSDTLRYIKLADLARGWVGLQRKPMDLCACVREERGDGEGAGFQALSLLFESVR